MSTLQTEISLTTTEKNLTWISILLIIYNFSANLSNDIYLPSMPTLVEIFSTTVSVLQLTMTAWFAGVAIPQLFFGPLSDRWGRRPLLIAGGICFIVATIVCALAFNVETLIVGRFFQGVGVCSLNVATFSLLSDLYNYKNRTRILNKINICGNLAPLIGPVLGGYILIFMGWRMNFIVILLLSLFSVLGLWYKFPESNLNLNPHALQFRNIYKNYLFLITSGKEFLRNLLPYCFMLGGLVIYLTAAPFIIMDTLKLPTQYFGFMQLLVFAAYILGSAYLNFALDDDKLKKFLALGIRLVLLASFFMLVLSYFFNNIFVLMVPMCLYAFGFSLCASPLISGVMSFPTPTKGSAAAVLGFGMAMSCMVSCATLSLVYNGMIFSLAGLLFIIAGLAALIYFAAQ